MNKVRFMVILDKIIIHLKILEIQEQIINKYSTFMEILCLKIFSYNYLRDNIKIMFHIIIIIVINIMKCII